MSAKPLDVCPKDVCPRKRWGKGAVKRGIGGGAGLIFKGTGFYITDYKNKKAPEKSGGDSAKPESKPTSKPASAAA
jgi:predicted nucleic acid-binding Zn ribbon protein